MLLWTCLISLKSRKDQFPMVSLVYGFKKKEVKLMEVELRAEKWLRGSGNRVFGKRIQTFSYKMNKI